MFSLSLNFFQVVASTEDNFFLGQYKFFPGPDQKAQHAHGFSHNSEILLTYLLEASDGGAREERRSIRTRSKRTLGHWFTKHHLAGGKSSGAFHSVPHPWTESGALKLTGEPCTPILFRGFNLTVLEPRTSGRLILVFGCALHMAARSQRPRSDSASASKI